MEQDSPLYRKGNTDLIIINAICLGLFVFTKVYYILRNAHRDRVWARMTAEVSSDNHLGWYLAVIVQCILMVTLGTLRVHTLFR